MKRRLFNFLAFLSLPGCVALAGVAAWGQFVSGGATFGPQNQRLTCRCTWRDGRVYAYYTPGYVTWFSGTGPSGSLAGVMWARTISPQAAPIFIAGATPAHVWAAALLFAVAPALYARRQLRDRPPGPGTCAACGYDLRATPEQCPECGAIPPPAGRHVVADEVTT